jgi:hypothetical protein
MSKLHKRVLSLMLACVFLLAMLPAALAAEGEDGEEGKSKAQIAAERLYALGLFTGTGTKSDGSPEFELDRAPTRHEAITMLVRLLGKEEEAKSGNWEIPFTDVAGWAKPYVGYAYANKLTSGTSATTFSGSDTVSATQYITFVLRALGYSSDSDFKWNRSWELSDTLGITNGRYNENSPEFLRGDIAIISSAALDAVLKEESITLLEVLREAGAVTESDPDVPPAEEPPAEEPPTEEPPAEDGSREISYWTNSDQSGGKEVVVLSYTAQPLDSGNTRFALKYIAPEKMNIAVFDPPNGDRFKLTSESVKAGETGELIFELKDEDLAQISIITVKFYSNNSEFLVVCYTNGSEPAENDEPSLLTDGKPVGESKPVEYYAYDLSISSGSVTISAFSAQSLDNGYTRYTLEYSVPDRLLLSVFDPPNGDRFMLTSESVEAGQPGEFIFDLPDDDTRQVQDITIGFFTEDYSERVFASFFPNGRNNDMPSLLTDGKPVGESRLASYFQDQATKTLPSGTVTINWIRVQQLDNGYLRLTMKYTVPENLKVSIFDPPNGDVFMLLSTVAAGETGELVFDLAEDDIRATESITIMLRNDNNDRHFVTINTDQLLSD